MIRIACTAIALLAGTFLPSASATAAVTINGRVSQIVSALRTGSEFSQGNFGFTINMSNGPKTLFKGIQGVRTFNDFAFLNDWVNEQLGNQTVFNGGGYTFTHSALGSYFNSPPASGSVFDGSPYKFTHSVLGSYFDTPQPEPDITGQAFLIAGPLEPTIAAQSANMAVPEPATWAMMVGGFAIIGASMRRRQAAVRTA